MENKRQLLPGVIISAADFFVQRYYIFDERASGSLDIIGRNRRYLIEKISYEVPADNSYEELRISFMDGQEGIIRKTPHKDKEEEFSMKMAAPLTLESAYDKLLGRRTLQKRLSCMGSGLTERILESLKNGAKELFEKAIEEKP